MLSDWRGRSGRGGGFADWYGTSWSLPTSHMRNGIASRASTGGSQSQVASFVLCFIHLLPVQYSTKDIVSKISWQSVFNCKFWKQSSLRCFQSVQQIPLKIIKKICLWYLSNVLAKFIISFKVTLPKMLLAITHPKPQLLGHWMLFAKGKSEYFC